METDTYIVVMSVSCYVVYIVGFIFHIVRAIVVKERITFGFIFWNIVLIAICIAVSSSVGDLIYSKIPYIVDGLGSMFY